MTTNQAVKNTTSEQREKRANSIAAMGLVTREGDRFKVSTPTLRGRQTAYEVWRDEKGKVRCSCLEFEEMIESDANFRCEHILAVKYAVLAKNSEAVSHKSQDSGVKSLESKDQPESETPVQNSKVNTQNVTESGEKKDAENRGQELGVKSQESKTESKLKTQNSKPEKAAIELSTLGEQQSNEVTAGKISVAGQTEVAPVAPQILRKIEGETVQNVVPNSLTDIRDERNIKMISRNNVAEMPFVTAEEFAENETVEHGSNVVNVDFTRTLQALKHNVNPEMVKQREGWTDRNGNTHLVEYVEWHTVADILDRVTPNWSHSIRDIKAIGDFVAVTAAITINGITREGIGTGAANSEMGIKKAEHDALKRAAVKFGIARELYQRESDVIEREGSSVPPTNGGFPVNPIARSIADLLTSKQLGMIRAIARDLNVEPDAESQNVMKCKTDELSKRAASSFIQHLQTMQNEAANNGQREMRRAG